MIGFPMLDSIAAIIVGIMVLRMGCMFAWDAMHDLMDRSACREDVAAIGATLLATPGVRNVHKLRTRKMGDMIMVDVHIEVDSWLTVETGHAIAVEARRRVVIEHRVIDVMTHVDPCGWTGVRHDGQDALTALSFRS